MLKPFPIVTFLGALSLLLASNLRAQVKIDVIQLLTDSTRTVVPDSVVSVATDSSASDSTQPQIQKPVYHFQIPQTAFVLTPKHRAEHLFQDLTQLLPYEMPVIPLVTGEVGWPRYVAHGELPSRMIATMIDSVWWIPGVYGTVDFTSLPEADNMTSIWTTTPSWFLPQHGLAGSFALASDTMNFAQPLSSAEYSKGPYGADAVRVNFSRAFSRRITGALHATFSNSDGQFVDLPYDGHKAMGKFEYRLNARWRVRYRHFNARNQAGIAVPFFLEEQPELANASHKEERLYHALELARAHAFTARVFSWQVKEELNDATRQIRHRLRDWGAEGSWQRQRERSALAAHVRLGNEEVRSTTLIADARFYQDFAAHAALRLNQQFWLQSAGQLRQKQDWPAAYSFALTGLYQLENTKLFWAKLGLYQIPPALAERENALPYLARNEELQAVRLQHVQLGGRVEVSTLVLQLTLGNAAWQHGLIYASDSVTTAFPEFGDSVQVAFYSRLHNQKNTRSTMGAQMSLRWQPRPSWLASVQGAWAQQQPAKQFWFWYQPESYGRASVATRLRLFEKTIAASPRLSVNYLGERLSPVFAATSTAPSFKALKAALTVDFQLRLLYGDGALFFAWENLLDAKFDLRNGVPHPGRIFRWGFWWKFLN